jgi:hypothetical protein
MAELALCDGAYGFHPDGGLGNVLDAATGNPHDFLAAFIAAEVVSAIEAAGLEDAKHSLSAARRKAVSRGLRNAAEIILNVADEL